MKSIYIKLFTILALVILWQPGNGQRKMEKLGRGVVATRTAANSVLVSWRLLGNDPYDIGFNLYRSTAGGSAVKINASVLTKGTNYTDNTANLSQSNSYFVKPVLNGTEQAASGSFTLPANNAIEPCLVVPLKAGNEIHFVWVGDLDGDGEYDYIVDRLDWTNGGVKVEAYKKDGTYLWTLDLGPNSKNMDNISPGSSCIDVGMWDGLTVYDMDNDGKAEIMVRTANGVVFGDGQTLTNANNNVQFISVLNGMTGAERARVQVPSDYLSVGPMACSMGIGYLNGITPSLLTFMRNRNTDGSFNDFTCAYDFNGIAISLKWKTIGSGGGYAHQMRILDFDGDGKDDFGSMGGVLKGEDGTLLYSLTKDNIYHGDRWYVGKLDPNRPGLQGYGIQQDNSTGVLEYYYDATTGKMLWKHMSADGGAVDVGRGVYGDIDPNAPGYEVWSFSGVYNAATNKLVSATYPYPNLRIWWDGDLLSENLNDSKIDKHNAGRLLTAWNYNGATGSARSVPMFYGDILGDWREEAIFTSVDYSKLVIFTTPNPTNHRIYTLPHNPAYRNCMTIKGYMQSHMVDYFLGSGMSIPPTPPMQSAKCVWKGGLSANSWDIATTSNWVINDTPTSQYTQGDDVMFDISGAPNTLVQLSDTIEPSSIKVISPINYTFSGTGSIAGTTGILKSGNGSLSLNVACDYTDTTRVEEGSLYVNDTITHSPILVSFKASIGGAGTISKPVILKKGAVITPGAQGSAGTLTFDSNLTLTLQSTCMFDITNDSTGISKPSDKIVVAGNLAFAGSNEFIFNKINSTVKAGEYPLIQYSGSLTGTLASVKTSGLFGQIYTLKDSIKTIWLLVKPSRSATTLVWSGTDSQWDLLTTPDWLNQGSADIFAMGDSVIFDSTGNAQNNVILSGDLPIGKMTIETATNDYSFSGTGNIAGKGGITKNGGGKLKLLNTTNSYTGKTIINGGTLEIGGLAIAGEMSSLGATSSTDPSYITLVNARLSDKGIANTYTTRGITINGTNDTIEIATLNKNTVISGVVAGTGKLVKTGKGNLALMNTNTYTGGTIVKEGNLDLGGSLGTGKVTFLGGAIYVKSTGLTNWNIEVPEGYTGYIATKDRCDFPGSLTGGGTLGIMVPWIREQFSGNWSAFTGTINLTADADGGECRLYNGNGYANTSFNLATGVTLFYDYGQQGNNGAQTVSLGSLAGVAGSYLKDENWVIGSKNINTTYAGIISGSSIRKVGTGEMTLSGANTFTGGTTVAEGTLVVANATGSATGTGAVTVKSGALLRGRGILTSAVTVENGGTVEPGNANTGTTLTLTSLTLNATSVYKANTNSTTLLASKVSATGNFTANGQLLLNKVNAEDYQVGQSFTVIVSPSITGTFASISPETPGTDMAWDTSTLYTDGKIKVVSTKTSGLKGITKEKLDVYPNPCTNTITVVLNRAIGNASITIENLNGQTIYSSAKEEMASETIDVAFLPVGVYIIQIKTDNAVYLSKFYKK